MLIQHKITKQIVEVDNPESYLSSGSWAKLESKEVSGVYGDFSKTELMKISHEQRNLPKSVVVDNLKDERTTNKIIFTDDLI